MPSGRPYKGHTAQSSRGGAAYGLRFSGLESDLLIEAPDEAWPRVRVERVQTGVEPPPRRADDWHATFPLLKGGHLDLDRRRRLARYLTPHPLDDDELAHPYLAATGAVFAHWLGLQSFHAGAFVHVGRAWLLLGPREGGKSTLLAMLHTAGRPVLADDIVVVRGRTALAAPRCIDLRVAAASRLELGDRARRARGGTHHRLLLPGAEPEVPLGGFVFLEWADELGLRRLPLRERLGRLNRQRWKYSLSEDPEGVLDLAALPCWELRRPRRWDGAGSVVERLLAAVAG